MATATEIEYKLKVGVDDTAVGRALNILDWYLADHPEKTIVVEQENDLRVCLIKEESNAEKQSI